MRGKKNKGKGHVTEISDNPSSSKNNDTVIDMPESSGSSLNVGNQGESSQRHFKNSNLSPAIKVEILEKIVQQKATIEELTTAIRKLQEEIASIEKIIKI